MECPDLIEVPLKKNQDTSFEAKLELVDKDFTGYTLNAEIQEYNTREVIAVCNVTLKENIVGLLRYSVEVKKETSMLIGGYGLLIFTFKDVLGKSKAVGRYKLNPCL